MPAPALLSAAFLNACWWVGLVVVLEPRHRWGGKKN